MANYYSDQFNATAGGTSIEDPRPFIDSRIVHAIKRYKRASVTTPAAVTTGEKCFFFTLRSSDRILALFINATAMTGTAMPCSVGVYATPDNGGAVIDLDTFGAVGDAPLDDLSTAVARTDITVLEASVTVQERGKPLWEIVNAAMGATTYAADPIEEWDIVLTMGTENAITAGNEIILDVEYTGGGQ